VGAASAALTNSKLSSDSLELVNSLEKTMPKQVGRPVILKSGRQTKTTRLPKQNNRPLTVELRQRAEFIRQARNNV